MSDDVVDAGKPYVRGRWYAGMPSPNPGGRSKAVAQLQELAREHTPAALAKIVSLMDDPKTSRVTQLACARELLDRAYGTPMQSTEISATVNDDNAAVSAFEVARRLAFLLQAGATDLAALPVKSDE